MGREWFASGVIVRFISRPPPDAAGISSVEPQFVTLRAGTATAANHGGKAEGGLGEARTSWLGASRGVAGVAVLQ